MGAVALVARREIRRRWRGVVVLTLLIGLVGAVVLAASAGARRTGTALDRFRESSLSADIELAVSPPTPEQMDQLRHVDGVAAVASLSALGVQVPTVPDLQSIGAVIDDQFGVTLDRDRIVAGRAPDPSVADEIAIGEGLATLLHLGVGDHLDVASYSPDQIEAILGGLGDAGAFAGPPVRLQIVGISRRPLDLAFTSAASGLLVLTPAFESEYADRIGQFGFRVRIRVQEGADVARVETEAQAIFGNAFATQRLADETEGARDATDLLARALWLFAGVAAIAGAVAIGFVLTREISLASNDQPTLRALGFTRAERVATTAPLALVAGVAGALLAVLGAFVASPLFPFGVARRADPDVGLHADWAVIALGTIASLVVIGLVALAAAWRASSLSPPGRWTAPTRARTSRLVDGVAGAGLPPAVANGMRMAVEPGRGRTALPVRSASVAAVLGVASVTAVLVFSASLGHLVDTPRLYGWTWDFKTLDFTSNTPCGAGDYGLTEVPGVSGAAEVCYYILAVDGRPVPGLAFTTLSGDPIGPEVIAGRAPRNSDEVALGATTLQKSGKSIGDTVNVRGRYADHDFKIVGRVAFPTLGQVQPLADGVALTGAGLAPIFDQNIFSRYLVGDIDANADHSTVEHDIGSIPQLTDPSGPAVPSEIDRLRQINWFPVSLAAFVGALAFSAVAYALVTSVRRRRRELAILKTLGFSRRQVQATIAWQATTLAAIGLLFGIPAGLLVGLQVWRRVADSLGVATTSRVPVLLVLALIPLALVLVNLVAFVPARTAARTRPSVALRSE